MKTYYSSQTKLIALFLVFVMVLPMAILGCEKKEPANEDFESYYASASTEWKKSAKYEVDILLPEGVTVEDCKTEDFTLSAFYNDVDSEEVHEISINSFTVTKKSDTVITALFTNPINTNLDANYVFMSKRTITNDKKGVGYSISLEKPDLSLTGQAEGFFSDSKKAVVSMEFLNNGTFSSQLATNMFTMPDEFDGCGLAVERVSDTCALLTVTDLPESINSEVIVITVDSSAIDSPFAEETNLEIPFETIHVLTNNISMTQDTLVATISATGGLLIKEGSVATDSNLLSLESTTKNTDGTITLSMKVKNMLPIREAVNNSMFTAELIDKDGNTYGTVEFYLHIRYGYIFASVSANDYDNKKAEITISSSGLTFAPDIALSDIEITGASALTNFAIKSKSDTKLVFTAEYTGEDGESITISIKDSKITVEQLKGDYTAELFVPFKDMGKSLTLVDISEAAVKGLAAKVGETVADMVLPYVFDFLDIDTSNPDIVSINNSINNLSVSIQTLTSNIGSLQDMTIVATELQTLDSYDELRNKLKVKMNRLLTDKRVSDYVEKLRDEAVPMIIQDNKEMAGTTFDPSGFISAIGDGEAYISDVYSFGNKLISASANLKNGAIGAFFSVTNHTYNFESQTIRPNKNFANSAYLQFLMNAAMAIQYCGVMGDALNAEMLRNLITNVSAVYKVAMTSIDEMEKRAAEGSDIILVSGQKVSKELISDFSGGTCEHHPCPAWSDSVFERRPIYSLSVSYDTYHKMIDRAKRYRNTTIASDLLNAGFSHVNENMDKEYWFYSSYVGEREEGDPTWLAVLKFYYGQTYCKAFYANLISNSGTERRDTKIATWTKKVYSMKRSTDNSTWDGYTNIIAFKAG